MPQFIAILREQLPQVAPSQTKYRVTELPSERTIRFYTANGLVDKPVASEGAKAHYGYRHLLQVLAIKYLQSQYLPLVKIRSLVDNISNRDLELLIPEISPVTAVHRGIARENRLIVENSFLPQVLKVGQRRPDQEVTSGERSSSDAADNIWRRVEIGPGIELHVHAAALSENDTERLRGTLLRELGVLRGWFGDQEK
jgi:DNA-binding transcriptional MerR regulator